MGIVASCVQQAIGIEPSDDERLRRELNELYWRIERNDPTLSRVSLSGDLKEYATARNGYGARLGAALHRNSVVTDMTLNLKFFLSLKEKYSIDRSMEDPLVEDNVSAMADVIRTWRPVGSVWDWMRHSTSLQSVTLLSSRGVGCGDHEALLLAILQALAPNQYVKSLECHITSLESHGWTTFLSTNTGLTSLRIELCTDELEMCHPTHLIEIEQTAHALAAHPMLEDIHLVVNADTILYFFRALQSHAKLRRLTIDPNHRGWRETASETLGLDLYSLLTTCTALEHVTLTRCNFGRDSFGTESGEDGTTLWARIVSGLQFNPSIASLSLEDSSWEEECAQEFLDANFLGQALQHVRRLRLTGNYFIRSNSSDTATTMTTAVAPPTLGNALALMVMSSPQLHHLDVSDRSFTENGMQDFFDGLTNSDQGHAALESLTIRHARYTDVLSDMAPFLPTTRCLTQLTIVVHPEDVMLDQLPRSFRRGLLGNGSLQQVEIQHSKSQPRGSNDAVSTAARCFIEAVTTRNWLLPRLMQTTTPKTSDAAENSTAAVATTDSRAASLTGGNQSLTLLPVLCTAAMPASLSSFQNSLIGLQSAAATAQDASTMGMGVGKRRSVKRVATVAMEPGSLT